MGDREILETYLDLLCKNTEETGMNTDPLSDYWDELVKIRVETGDLRRELEKYQGLIEYLGQLSTNLNFCYTFLDTHLDNTLTLTQKEFNNLQALNEEQREINKKLERKLNELDALYIMNATIN